MVTVPRTDRIPASWPASPFRAEAMIRSRSSLTLFSPVLRTRPRSHMRFSNLRATEIACLFFTLFLPLAALLARLGDVFLDGRNVYNKPFVTRG
jgi:hypothetical protein